VRAGIKSQPDGNMNVLAEKQGVQGISASKDDTFVVKFIDQILLDAIEKKASDIHFEPYDDLYRIRYRLDGFLTEVAAPSIHLANRITARIKIMSDLDIAERRIPQDGRLKITLPSSRIVDFRVSSCPTINGEKVVIRILDSEATKPDIEQLGLTCNQQSTLFQALQKTQGMILITGPTGSGKTVSLYAALNILNTIETNIITIEDPVEIKIPGINQVNVNPKAGLTFATALRAFLRQDPDVIMVGEIRDKETAEIAVKAAHTGHLVLSTLHTNSAVETITRLFNMGIPAFNIAGSVALIIAQRLVRRLCNHCKTVTAGIYKPRGCVHCTNGYRGRTGLFELLPVSKTIANMMIKGSSSIDLLKQAQHEGMMMLNQSGLALIQQGITTIEEVNRVSIE